MTATRFATLAGRVALVGLAVGAFVWALTPHYRDLIAGVSTILLVAAVIAAPRLDARNPAIATIRVLPAVGASALGTLISIRGWLAGGMPAFAPESTRHTG